MSLLEMRSHNCKSCGGTGHKTIECGECEASGTIEHRCADNLTVLDRDGADGTLRFECEVCQRRFTAMLTELKRKGK